MKKQNIWIPIILLVMIVTSAVLLSEVFHDPVCEILKAIIKAVMTSCLIAFPGYYLLIYRDYQKANQMISSYYFRIYYILQNTMTETSQYDTDALNGLIEVLSNTSVKIGQIREESFVSKKYNHDKLTAQIAELTQACQAYMNGPLEKRTQELHHIKKCKTQIIEHICAVENFV